MLNTPDFTEFLVSKIDFFAGVPDSLLKDLNACLMKTLPKNNFWTNVNEGQSVAMCVGHYLATKRPGAIYMQNSGIGNAINPLLSLADELVYSIPMLLLTGWRGEPDTKDEPQHKKQGLVTKSLFDACQIPYKVLPQEFEEAKNAIEWAMQTMEQNSAPAALLIRKETFSKFAYEPHAETEFLREAAIETVLKVLPKDSIIISSTGMISRELYELREKRNEGFNSDFLCIGAMGHASIIAFEIALQKPKQKVVCLDGDGAMLMHLGALATIGTSKAKNFIHIVLNNGTHASVGGQPTVARQIKAMGVAENCGYSAAFLCENKDELANRLEFALHNEGRFFIEAIVSSKARENLGRPKGEPKDWKTKEK